MSPAQQEALKRALLLLTASGAQYKVITDDGDEYGELVAAPKIVKLTRKSPDSYRFKDLYKPILANLKAGQAHVFHIPKEAPETVTAVRLQSAISAAAIHLWGNGNAICMQTSDGRSVELLRLL